ncbi:MAG TPA: OsmC family protein [Anaerolineaceae bacterium]|nr:OsmC family protein [Anaerolineaceae bacterium]HQN05263.1 OsmC family protein [Anaerolineaceae bacterium]HQP07874.1 OsmC family protein [Anaerolineaceae bacterium]
MSSAAVRWVGGKQFIGVDSTKHSVVLSTPDEGVGMKPSEMLLVALASCTSVDVVEIMAKRRTPLSMLEVGVSAEQDSDPPWTFRKIHLHYRLAGAGITVESAKMAIKLSEEKYCSVAATIRGVAEITWDFELVDGRAS